MAEPTASSLPQLHARMAELRPELVRYVARPGFRALPAGTLTIIAFVSPQCFSLAVFLWAIWWPFPRSAANLDFAIASTGLFAVLAVAVTWALLRGRMPLAKGIVLAPFIRLTVTDRRLVWTLPWTTVPFFELGLERVRGAVLGPLDRRGCGNAAVLLWPGDPAADFDGAIHFDRLPQAARFVEAFG